MSDEHRTALARRRVLHVIVGLDVGGAERMLARLIGDGSERGRYEHIVVSLTTIGTVGQQLAQSGVHVTGLGIRTVLDGPWAFVRLIHLIRRLRPDVVQTWMYHADIVGGLAARLAGVRRVLWGIRCSAPRRYRPGASALTRWVSSRPVVVIGAVLSRFVPERIVCCAVAARASHADVGYAEERMVVVVNGYDCTDIEAAMPKRAMSRRALGVGDSHVVVGITGRFNELKGYRVFIEAAAEVAAAEPAVRFVMLGRGVDASNQLLGQWLQESGIANRFVLLGERNDVPDWLAAMDVFCSSSLSEGFPNVICEAMIARLPCVVTDAGDAAEILGPAGLVVTPNAAGDLASALLDLVRAGAEERARLGEIGHDRVKTQFSLAGARARFERLYRLGDVHGEASL